MTKPISNLWTVVAVGVGCLATLAACGQSSIELVKAAAQTTANDLQRTGGFPNIFTSFAAADGTVFRLKDVRESNDFKGSGRNPCRSFFVSIVGQRLPTNGAPTYMDGGVVTAKNPGNVNICTP